MAAVLKRDYGVDTEAVRAYFPLDHVVATTMLIYQVKAAIMRVAAIPCHRNAIRVPAMRAAAIGRHECHRPVTVTAIRATADHFAHVTGAARPGLHRGARRRLLALARGGAPLRRARGGG